MMIIQYKGRGFLSMVLFQEHYLLCSRVSAGPYSNNVNTAGVLPGVPVDGMGAGQKALVKYGSDLVTSEIIDTDINTT